MQHVRWLHFLPRIDAALCSSQLLVQAYISTVISLGTLLQLGSMHSKLSNSHHVTDICHIELTVLPYLKLRSASHCLIECAPPLQRAAQQNQ